MRLEGKVAVVTGGAMGNGLGIVEAFLREGAYVYILDYASSLDDTVNNLKNTYVNVKGFKVDIRNRDDLHNVKRLSL